MEKLIEFLSALAEALFLLTLVLLLVFLIVFMIYTIGGIFGAWQLFW